MRNEDDVPDRFWRYFCRRWQAEAAVVDGQLDEDRDGAEVGARVEAPLPPTAVGLSPMVLPGDQPAPDPGAARPAGGAWVVNVTRRVRFWCPEGLAAGYVGASRLVLPDAEFALLGGEGVAREVSVHPLALSRMESPDWRMEEASLRGISSEVRIDFTGDDEDRWCPGDGEGDGLLDSP